MAKRMTAAAARLEWASGSDCWVDLGSPIGLATAKESSRYAINGALAFNASSVPGDDEDDPGRVWLTATDGRLLAVTEADGRVPGRWLIPGEVLTSNGRQRAVKAVDGGAQTSDGRTVDNVHAGDEPVFPPCPDVMPEAAADYKWIGVNAEFLARAVSAAGSYQGKAYIGIGPHNKPVLAVALGESGDPRGVAVVMPLSASDSVNPEDHQGAMRGAYMGKRDAYRADWNRAHGKPTKPADDANKAD